MSSLSEEAYHAAWIEGLEFASSAPSSKGLASSATFEGQFVPISDWNAIAENAR